jgi:two-component system LytT family sensor kinase
VLNVHEPLLVNTIGHAAGALIFGIFLFLFLKDRASSRSLRGSWLSFTAALLAFLWDLGSLAAIVSATRKTGEEDLWIAFSFAMLSILPAVLLHLSLGAHLRALVVSGYGLSFVAAAMHFWQEFHSRSQARQEALILIPVGFGLLTAVAAGILATRHGVRPRGETSRILGAMCLFLFAVSFAHFRSESPDRAWSTELIIHHAGIPLALFVLLQDYRFVMLDAFVRFLANFFLAALVTFAVIRTGLKLLLVETHSVPNPLYEALWLTALCLVLIGFALLRGRLQQWLTGAVFRRPNLERALQQIRTRPAPGETENDYLRWAASEIAVFMNTARFEVISEAQFTIAFGRMDLLLPVPAAIPSALRGDKELAWAEAIVPLRFSLGDQRFAVLGRRRGGRRYLSEDLTCLGRLAAAVTDQVERIRASEMQRLVSQAELRALQSQINPHFLFNALNTLYGTIARENAGARRTVLNLADIFRYFLQPDKTFIPLDEELKIIHAYLEIEHLRLGSRLLTQIDVDESALTVPIPILSIQPLVENAIKHGISARSAPGTLSLRVRRSEKHILVSVEDTGPGMRDDSQAGSGAKLGLANVSRRLELCYGTTNNLTISSSAAGTKVEFSVPSSATSAGFHERDEPAVC